jgi:hypothetical protein
MENQRTSWRPWSSARVPRMLRYIGFFLFLQRTSRHAMQRTHFVRSCGPSLEVKLLVYLNHKCWARNKSARGRTVGAWSLPLAEVKNEEYMELYRRCRMRHGSRAKWRNSNALESYSRGTGFESRPGHRSLQQNAWMVP